METVLHFIFAFIALGVLVFVHELGHYLVALKVKMKVEVFSIGFGRPIVSWMRGDVRWQIGWIPFGGYVKITGMEFGKDQNENAEGGFFTKKPFDRLKVAIAGPLANLLLALLIFFVVWISGGRDKPFSEFTNRVGYVDPSSEVYKEGLRSGDILKSFNGKPYSGTKDLFYAAMFTDGDITLEGLKVNEQTHQEEPFSYKVKPYQMPGALDGIKTVGILGSARYLNYMRLPDGQENPLPQGSPMENSGLTYGDRIVWADGSIVYSLEQLSSLINESKALLTIERNNKVILARVPRVNLSELKLSYDQKGEISDWQYLGNIKGRANNLYFIPYNITSDLVVENEVPFIDSEVKKIFFGNPYLTGFDSSLKEGDKILAIDSIPVTHGSELLKNLQSRQVAIIVQRGIKETKPGLWYNADATFNDKYFLDDVNELVKGFTNVKPQLELKDLAFLKPVAPKTLQNFSLDAEQKALVEEQLSAQKKKIDEISDPKKRSQAQIAFEESQKKLMLGVYLQDEKVNYNPNPFVLFANVFAETWQTLVALFSGYLNPKWLSGPVGIVQVMQHGLSIGLNEALFWVAAISINLGFLNLLPIPVLDGGYIILCIIEMLSGKRLKPKTMERIILPFMVLLIGFLIFVTYWDLLRLF
jgi:regulator of sigma E protease